MIYLNGLPVPTTMFPDNTSQVWKLPEEILNTTNFAHITWEYSHEGEFMQLAQLKYLLDYYNFRCALRITYLPYARQDKEPSNTTTFALWPFAKMLNALEFEQVIITDPHSEVALSLIVNSSAVYPIGDVYAALEKTGCDLLCYPDKGAVTKYTKIYEYHDHVYGEKVRDQLTGNILSYKLVGDVSGRNVMIIDDICDGGMTFKILAKDLLASGAKSVVLFVSHGIFSKGVKTLIDSGISRVFTSDGEVTARFNSVNV